MWILELIIVIVLITNDFTFRQVLLIMICWVIAFYGFILPIIMGSYVHRQHNKAFGLNKSNAKEIIKWKALDIFNNEYYNESIDSLILEDIKNELTNSIVNADTKTLENVLNENKVEQSIYTTLFEILHNNLTSWKYTIYSPLNWIDILKWMLRKFNHTANKLEELWRINKNDLKTIKKKIKDEMELIHWIKF